jgi:hypothetical protein
MPERFCLEPMTRIHNFVVVAGGDERVGLTANDVPGRKNIVKIAICFDQHTLVRDEETPTVFMDRLSFFISSVSSCARIARTRDVRVSS